VSIYAVECMNVGFLRLRQILSIDVNVDSCMI
jgi:hypothetical protein